MTTRLPRPASFPAFGVIVALTVTLLPGCAPEPPPGAEASTVVGKDGFTLELEGGTTVTGPAGAAPEGTEVSAELVDAPIPDEFSFAAALGSGVNVELGDGLQPSSPLSITLPVPEGADPDRTFVIRESDEAGRGVEFVESVFDAQASTATIVADHLSWYAVTHVDDSSFGQQFGAWIDTANSVRTTKPGCVDEPDPVSGMYVLADPWPDSAWVCAGVDGNGEVAVDLTSNSGLVFELLAHPRPQWGRMTALDASGLATAVLATRLLESGSLEGEAVLLAGGSMNAAFEEFDQSYFEMKIEPGLTQVAAIAFGLGMVLPDEWMETVDWFECATGALESTIEGSAEQFSAIVDCVAVGVGGVGGDLLGIISTGPGLLATQIEGLWREASGQNVESFTVYLVPEDALREPPEGAIWLFGIPSNASESASGEQDIATLPGVEGSYPFSANQWIGCGRRTSDTTYQLGGQYQSFDFGFALQAHTPAGLTATYTLLGDGVQLLTGQTTTGDPLTRQQLDVSGVDELRVETHTDDTCGSASKGYGAFVQGYVS
ncbi:hypothetical protein [Agromyces binzhouensis]|uniref:hypothetical protein n=1 Tax=Agromyces binzhouensis TaxID=1817495 RepID=UPI00363D69AC